MEEFKSNVEGEYNNTADLMGIDTDGIHELLGKISRLPKEQQAKAIRQITKRGSGTPSGTGNSRHEMEQRFSQLPDEIRKGLLNKRLQLTDTRFYVVKEISDKNSIDIFQGTDQKSVTLGNIANQKLEKDNWFILFAIRVLYAESPDGKEKADFSHIPSYIRNGEFELEAGNKKLVGLTENGVFDTRERHDIPIGFYKLENTKIIEPQVEIKMPVKFGVNASKDSFLRVVFIGTSVIPY